MNTRAVIQRVKSCSVSVEGREISSTGTGLLVLLGVARDDTDAQVDYLAGKLLSLRIFPDRDGKMNLSVSDVGGELMVVSQFTLLADTRKGRRPSFVAAADPEKAEALYMDFVVRLRHSGLTVETGAFGELMMVSLENWGPVTIVIDTA